MESLNFTKSLVSKWINLKPILYLFSYFLYFFTCLISILPNSFNSFNDLAGHYWKHCLHKYFGTRGVKSIPEASKIRDMGREKLFLAVKSLRISDINFIDLRKIIDLRKTGTTDKESSALTLGHYFLNLLMLDLFVIFKYYKLFNQFSTNVPLLYPLKTSENRRYRNGLNFSIFQGVHYTLKRGLLIQIQLIFSARSWHPISLQSTLWC